MLGTDGNDHHPGIAGARLGASAGPLSLLLLPKCPLCLLPLLAYLGIAISPSMGLSALASIVVVTWLAAFLVLTRKQPLIRAVAFIAAVVTLVAMMGHSRPLVWAGVLAMAAAGVALSRTCAIQQHVCRKP